MKRVAVLLITVLFFSQSALAEEPESSPEKLPDNVREWTPEEIEALRREMEAQFPKLLGREQGFVVVPPGTVLDENPPKLPGKWKEVDGARICDGYLTRIAGDEYCSAEIPSDWGHFEFDGRKYYFAPISD